jgi:hypothetical protein
MIFEVAGGAVCIWAGVEIIKARRTRKALERRMAFYQDQSWKSDETMRPAFEQGSTELCGGCGHMVLPEQLEACAGVDCPNYKEVANPKKIPIGYRGHLHSGNRSYMK